MSHLNRTSFSSHHVPALDGLRGIAILMVLWGHFTPLWLPGKVKGFPGLAHNLLNGGWAGVDLFFVLSGFLISGILMDARHLPAGPFFGRFYARRTLRIFPLYYFVLACVGLWLTCWVGGEAARAWSSQSPWLWLYASNIVTAQSGWSFKFDGLVLNHFWTLAVEEQFYLVWPAVVFFCGKRALRDGCIALIVLAPLLRYYWSVENGNSYAAFALMPCRIDSFAIGTLVALFARGGCPVEKFSRVGGWLTLAGVALVIPSFWTYAVIDVVGRSALAILVSGLILLTLGGGPIARLLAGPPLRFLGRYSYGIYVLHYLFYYAIDRIFPVATLGIIPRFVGCVAVSTLLAWCSWHLLEKHFLKLKSRFPMSAVESLPPLSQHHSVGCASAHADSAADPIPYRP